MPHKFSSHLNFSKFTMLQIYIKVHIIVDFQEISKLNQGFLSGLSLKIDHFTTSTLTANNTSKSILHIHIKKNKGITFLFDNFSVGCSYQKSL